MAKIDTIALGNSPSEHTKILTFDKNTDQISVADLDYLKNADFIQDGSDLLITGDDGSTIIIEGYFEQATPPNLITPQGGVFTATLVDSFLTPEHPGQYAGPTEGQMPVGAVHEASGHATVTRVDGTTEEISLGTPVFQGDIIETDAEGAVNIVFVDETSFAVSEDARLAIDEYVYDPATESGSTDFSVLKGVFVYTSGMIGRDDPDDVNIETPVGSIGIRGTIIAGDVDNAEITVVEGAIVLRDFSGHEMTLAGQFETARFNPVGGGIENIGMLSAQDVGARFASVSNVAPTLFSSIGDAAREAPEGRGADGAEGQGEGGEGDGTGDGGEQQPETGSQPEAQPEGQGEAPAGEPGAQAAPGEAPATQGPPGSNIGPHGSGPNAGPMGAPHGPNTGPHGPASNQPPADGRPPAGLPPPPNPLGNTQPSQEIINRLAEQNGNTEGTRNAAPIGTSAALGSDDITIDPTHGMKLITNGTKLTYDASFTDANGDALTYSIVSVINTTNNTAVSNSWVSIDANSGLLTINIPDNNTLIDDATYTIKVSASDDNATSYANYTLTVDNADFTGTPTADTVTISTDGYLAFGYNGDDTFNIDNGVDNAKIFGGAGNDHLNMSADTDNSTYIEHANHISSPTGNEIVYGIEKITMGEGSDTFVISNSGNALELHAGNVGSDTLDFSNINDTVEVTLNDSTPANIEIAGVSSTLTAYDFENIKGGSVNDTLNGNASINTIHGQGGNDTIQGNGGNDFLYGDAGMDTFKILNGDGNNVIDGGSGANDIYDATGVTQDSSVTFSAGSITVDHNATDMNTLTNIEIIQTGSGNDTFFINTNTANNLQLFAGSGMDVLDFSTLTSNSTYDDTTSKLLFDGKDAYVNSFEIIHAGTGHDEFILTNNDKDINAGGGNDKFKFDISTLNAIQTNTSVGKVINGQGDLQINSAGLNTNTPDEFGDSLEISGAGTLDFSQIHNDYIKGIETIRIVDGNDQTIRIGFNDVIAMTEEYITNTHRLIIDAESGDTIEFDTDGHGGSGPTAVTINNTAYSQYTYSDGTNTVDILIHNAAGTDIQDFA